MKSITLLDCSTLLPGPLLTKLLRQQGARVIKVEHPNRPDGARALFASRALYDDLNEGKEIVKLDLTQAGDRDRFETLVREADGLIEGFRPAAKAKLGLDEATLLGINPRLCIASLVGYPEHGPWRDRAGHDLNFAAVSGLLSLSNEKPALPLADLFTAYQGAVALASALSDVARGGPGRRIVISMSETLKQVQSGLVREFQTTGAVPLPGETLFSGAFPCYRLYTAGCGRRVSVGAIEPKFWRKVCEILDAPEMIDQAYAKGAARDVAVAKIQERFSSRDWTDWAPLFDSADCCVEPVLSYPEVFSKKN